MDTNTGMQQGMAVIKSYSDGQISWTKMIGVLKSIPWGKPGRSGGDYMAAADVPVPTGPLLNGVLGAAIGLKHLSEDDADKVAAALL